MLMIRTPIKGIVANATRPDAPLTGEILDFLTNSGNFHYEKVMKQFLSNFVGSVKLEYFLINITHP